MIREVKIYSLAAAVKGFGFSQNYSTSCTTLISARRAGVEHKFGVRC
jgi:hypothetical protein